MTITEAPAKAGRDVRKLVLDGTGIPMPALQAILALAANRNLVQPQAYQMFMHYLAEAERCRAVQAGEPIFRSLDAGMCESDRDAALADLLDGTDTYHGDRR